jgi:hypothetical protein
MRQRRENRFVSIRTDGCQQGGARIEHGQKSMCPIIAFATLNREVPTTRVTADPEAFDYGQCMPAVVEELRHLFRDCG